MFCKYIIVYSSDLKNISEGNMLVLQCLQSHPLRNVWMQLSTTSIIFQNSILVLVLLPHPEISRRHVDSRKGEEAEHSPMASIVPRGLGVDPGAHDGEGDPKDLGECPCGPALGEVGSVDR